MDEIDTLHDSQLVAAVNKEIGPVEPCRCSEGLTWDYCMGVVHKMYDRGFQHDRKDDGVYVEFYFFCGDLLASSLGHSDDPLTQQRAVLRAALKANRLPYEAGRVLQPAAEEPEDVDQTPQPVRPGDMVVAAAVVLLMVLISLIVFDFIFNNLWKIPPL